MCAAGNSHVVCAEILIQNGTSVNCQAAEGLTTVIRCSDIGYCEILDLLIKSGSDLNTGKTDGTTPLMHAAKKGHVKCTKHFMRSNSGSTALVYAAQYGRSDCVEELLQAGADVNMAYSSNFIALLAAAAANKQNAFIDC